MNEDLEQTLVEMGSEYRAVVARLRGAATVSPPHGRRWLVAASILVLLGLGFFFLRPGTVRCEARAVVFGAPEYHASVDEMIATQNPDGSWKNDFLTRRNAAALRCCGDPAAQVAYKRALRNLRERGIL